MINDDEITALVRGIKPIVREYVEQAICKTALIPPELAEQVASAVRLLHEAPPVVERSEAPAKPSLPRVTRVERDEQGNFVPVYDEPKS